MSALRAIAAALVVLATVGVLPAVAARPAAETDRTNVIVVMLDDVPMMDERLLSRMPNIKALFLDQGLRFTRYHGNDPLCCPGRAAFLSGLTTDHHGLNNLHGEKFDPRVTIGTEMRAAGYRTFWAGKYLHTPPQTPNVKTELSIDRTPPGWDDIATIGNIYYDYNEYLNGRRIYHGWAPDDYQPDVTFDRAVQFLRDTPTTKPVFGVITPFTVHNGITAVNRIDGFPVAAPRYKDDARCDGIGKWWTPAHSDDPSDRPADQRGLNQWRDGYPLAKACRSLLATDEGIGRIRDALFNQGRLRNTVFILTADNGMGWGAHGQEGKKYPWTTGMPLYVRWPDGRGTDRATDHTFLLNVDMAPTICAIGGCVMGPYPDGRQGPDGVSFLPIILGTGTVTRQALYTEHLEGNDWRALRTTPDSPLGLWHYAEYESGERELYDVSGGQCWEWSLGDPGDPCERTNLAGDPAFATVEAALRGMLDAARQTGGAGRRFKGHTTKEDHHGR